MLSRLRAWLRAIVAPGAVERDIDDELRYHLERDAESFGRQGLNPEEARRAALRAFGGVEPAREAMRDAAPIRLVTDLKQDAGYALRMLRRDPALALVATLTLTLVIGANTAVFSVVNAVLLRPLNFPSADRLVVITEQTPSRPQMAVAYPDYRDFDPNSLDVGVLLFDREIYAPEIAFILVVRKRFGGFIDDPELHECGHGRLDAREIK